MPQYTREMTEEFLGPEKTPVSWPWGLMSFSFILLGMVLLIYFGIKFGYQPYLKTEKDSLDQQINQITSGFNETDQQDFINFYSQLANIQDIFNEHIKGSNVFSFLEKNTSQGIYYKTADLSVKEYSLKLQGTARNYEDLIQQVAVFEQAPELEKTILGEIHTAEKGVEFSAELILKKDFFNFNK